MQTFGSIVRRTVRRGARAGNLPHRSRRKQPRGFLPALRRTRRIAGTSAGPREEWVDVGESSVLFWTADADRSFSRAGTRWRLSTTELMRRGLCVNREFAHRFRRAMPAALISRTTKFQVDSSGREKEIGVVLNILVRRTWPRAVQRELHGVA